VPAAPEPAPLAFEDPHHRALFERLAAHAATVGEHGTGRRTLGNWVEERWCNAAVDPQLCDSGAIANETVPGARWAGIATFGYPDRFPRVFGVLYEAGDLAAEGTWGASLRLAVGGGSIVSSSLELSFHPLPLGSRPPVRLGGWDHRVADTTFRLSRGATAAESDAALEAELRELARSPEAFVARVTTRLDALLAEVRRGVNAGEARRDVLRAVEPPPRPPLAVPTPLTAAEQAEALALAERELDGVKARVRAEGAGMYEALKRLLPAEW
jgi:hypothetical protein